MTRHDPADVELPWIARTSVLDPAGDDADRERLRDRLSRLAEVRGHGLAPLTRAARTGSAVSLTHLVPDGAVTLASLRSQAPLRLGHALQVASDVASALAALHAHDLAHGRVDSDVLLVAPDGSVVLAGTGVAWRWPPGRPGGPTPADDVAALADLVRDLVGDSPLPSSVVLALLRAGDADPALRPDAAALRAQLLRAGDAEPLLDLLWLLGSDPDPSARPPSDPGPRPDPRPDRRPDRDPDPGPGPGPGPAPSRVPASAGPAPLDAAPPAPVARLEPRALRSRGAAARGSVPGAVPGRGARRRAGGTAGLARYTRPALSVLALAAVVALVAGLARVDIGRAEETAGAGEGVGAAVAAATSATSAAASVASADTVVPTSSTPTDARAAAEAGSGADAGLDVDRATTSRDWGTVVSRLDDARYRAIADGSVTALGAVVDPAGSAWAADAALAERVRAADARLTGGRLRLLEVRALSVDPRAAVLLVHDARDPYDVTVDGRTSHAPGRDPRWWRLTLSTRPAGDWRVHDVVPVAGPAS